MTFDDDRLAALRAYGYTDRESRFLYLVATHSGYFLANHFVRFIQSGHGWAVNAFITKALEKRHVRHEPHSSAGAKRYHLYARVLYRAIGKEHSRNRKRHTVRWINVKLYALRFVLDHLSFEYLEEEPDKVDYFVNTHELSEALLPARTYAPKNSSTKEPVTRYFVDRFPLFLTEESTPVFTFIDERETTTEAFRTHVLQHLALLRALPVPSKMIFVSPVRHKFKDAERLFSRLISSDSHGVIDHELLNYFDLRHRWEADDLKGFNKDMFRQRIDGEKRYSTPYYEDLYQKWLAGHTEATPNAHGKHTTNASFDTYWISSAA